MRMNRLSGIIDTVINTQNYVDFILLSSGQAGHNTAQSTTAFTYNVQNWLQRHTQATVCEHSKEVFLVNKSVTDIIFRPNQSKQERAISR